MDDSIKNPAKQIYDEIVETWGEDENPIENLRFFCCIAMDAIDYSDSWYFFDKVEEQKNKLLDEIIMKIPGGSICDPQQIADMIRTFKDES